VSDEDQHTINELAKALKEEIKFIHVFLLAFANNVRWNAHVAEQFRLFEAMFGEELWDNAVLLGTQWPYHPEDERRRNQTAITEETRRRELNNKLSLYGRKKDLKMVFIDSYYNVSSDHKEVQRDKFKENTERLWELANRMTPFDCKDVKAARLRIKELQKELDNKKKELDNQKREIYLLQDLLKPNKTRDTSMAQMAHTSIEFAMASLGFCVLGMIIALVAIAALKRCTSESEDYDVENANIVYDNEREDTTRDDPPTRNNLTPTIEVSSSLSRENSANSKKSMLDDESKSRKSE